MFSFFSKQKPAFGLDLSDTSLRMMELGPFQNGFFPTAFSEVLLPKGLVKDDQVENPESLSKLIMRAKAQPTFGKFRSPYVVLSVPESKSFVRVISVPKMTDEEAQEAVPFEAEQYIPMAIDQVYMDFMLLSETEGGKTADKTKAVICATPRLLIEKYVAAVKLAKLKPIAVEVESEAVARCLISQKNKNVPVMILDIDAQHASIIIYDLGALQFTSSVPIGGDSFTNQISQQLAISLQEAEKLKRQFGLLPGRDAGRIKTALQPQLNSLTEAVGNAINYYREHSDSSREISQLLLCGSGSKLKGLSEFFIEKFAGTGKSFRRTVQLGDPWVNIMPKSTNKVPPISKMDSISFTTVIGLAMRGVQSE